MENKIRNCEKEPPEKRTGVGNDFLLEKKIKGLVRKSTEKKEILRKRNVKKMGGNKAPPEKKNNRESINRKKCLWKRK